MVVDDVVVLLVVLDGVMNCDANYLADQQRVVWSCLMSSKEIQLLLLISHNLLFVCQFDLPDC